MNKNIDHILITEEEIAAKVKEIAEQINKDYAGKEIVCVCILKGAVIFFGNLVKNLNMPLSFDFMIVSSYENGTVSSGNLNIKKDLEQDICGKHVLIIEDILDTGNTLKKLKDELVLRNPASIKLCSLLDKPSRRTADIKCDYTGFEIPDEFVVGYGLDFDEKYRHLPYIGVLKPECYINN
ncbi:MAG: hypoxanthine phosphoribosyltransferase [Clostridia bacterium]|nr:hypoxanthine phosphoribosyltransferase [Clostridia bacterium]